MLKSSLQQLYGRHNELVDSYEIFIFQMAVDFYRQYICTIWQSAKTQSSGDFVCHILQKKWNCLAAFIFKWNDTVMYGVYYPGRILFSILSSFFKMTFITTSEMVYGHYKTIYITFFHNKIYNTT